MSGPKVVRIVTLEEVRRICDQHLAQVADAARVLREQARRCGRMNGALEATIAAQVARLEQMLEAQRWLDVQKHAPGVVASLRAEGARIQAEVVAQAEAARSRRRRIADTARTLAGAFAAAGMDVPPGVRAAGIGAVDASDDELSTIERELSNALAVLPTVPKASAPSREREELLRRLDAGGAGQTVTDWLAAQAVAPTSAERRLDKLLAELDAMGTEAAAEFSGRAEFIAREASTAQRALLTDSLVLDVGAYVERVRKDEACLAELGTAKASLAGLKSQASRTLSSRIDTALERRAVDEADALCNEASALAAAEIKEAAAAARRQLVLSGLASLGYEVRETMATAWARDGRIVVCKPGAQDYGVELGAPSDASRLQVRLVGSDHPHAARSTRRDADQEAIWCGEFDRLKASLAASGNELVIERALEPGAQVVRTVALPATRSEERTVRQAAPTQRKLP